MGETAAAAVRHLFPPCPAEGQKEAAAAKLKTLQRETRPAGSAKRNRLPVAVAAAVAVAVLSLLHCCVRTGNPLRICRSLSRSTCTGAAAEILSGMRSQAALRVPGTGIMMVMMMTMMTCSPSPSVILVNLNRSRLARRTAPASTCCPREYPPASRFRSGSGRRRRAAAGHPGHCGCYCLAPAPCC
jgi:hypothetical protein